MIYIVAKTINLLAHILQSVFTLASLVGRLIVTLFSTVVTSVLTVVQNIALFFQIIYEDNVFIFTEELPNLGNTIFNACSEQWNIIHHLISHGYNNCFSSLSETWSRAHWAASAACTILAEVVILMKKALVFAGNTLWLILTFLPIHLPLLIKQLVKCIRDVLIETLIEAYLRLLKVTNFLTDVPLESFIGIISAIVIVRLCVHFRENIETVATRIYWLMLRKLLYLYHAMYNYFTDSEVRAITQLAAGPELQQTSGGAVLEEDTTDPTEALCVVCQERQKCVLILPCRHVCLCRECCLRLYSYQRTCPICRTFIYHSVTIYL